MSKRSYPMGGSTPTRKTANQWIQEGKAPKKGEKPTTMWTNGTHKEVAAYYTIDQVEDSPIIFESYKAEKKQRAIFNKAKRKLEEAELAAENARYSVDTCNKALFYIRRDGYSEYYEGTAEYWEERLKEDTEELEKEEALIPSLRQKKEEERKKFLKLQSLNQTLLESLNNEEGEKDSK